MILARLKEETRPLHDDTERQFDLLAPGLNPARYADALSRFYGFYAPLETHLAGVPGVRDAVPDLDARLKADFIANDLIDVGYTALAVATLPRCPDIPRPDNLAGAFGCLYVLEGATLGGQIIRRHLAATLGVTAESGCRFFSSYGDRVGAMWKAFGTTITARVTTPGDEDDAVRAACATFRSLGAWLSAGKKLANESSRQLDTSKKRIESGAGPQADPEG